MRVNNTEFIIITLCSNCCRKQSQVNFWKCFWKCFLGSLFPGLPPLVTGLIVAVNNDKTWCLNSSWWWHRRTVDNLGINQPQQEPFNSCRRHWGSNMKQCHQPLLAVRYKKSGWGRSLQQPVRCTHFDYTVQLAWYKRKVTYWKLAGVIIWLLNKIHQIENRSFPFSCSYIPMDLLFSGSCWLVFPLADHQLRIIKLGPIITQPSLTISGGSEARGSRA